MTNIYLILLLAVIAETIATTALQASHQFTRLGPSLVVLVGYAISFFLLSMTLRVLPVGITYAIWSGLGIVLISLIAFVLFGQKLDMPAILGLGMIIGGILVINVFSNSVSH